MTFNMSQEIMDNTILNSLNNSSKLHLIKHGTVRPFFKGQTIFDPSAPSNDLAFPLSGTIVCRAMSPCGDRVGFRLAGRDHAIGLGALFLGSSAPYDASGLTPGKALFIAAETIRDCSHHIDEILGILVNHVIQETGIVIQNFACAAQCNATSRIAQWLLQLHHLDTRDLFDITQKDIGHLFNLRMATINAVIQTLSNDGAVIKRRGKIGVADRTRLSNHCRGCHEARQTNPI